MNINEVPKYIMHSDGIGDDSKVLLIDSGTVSMSFEMVDNGIKINDTLFYNASKVDALLSALKTEIQSWVSSNYQHK